MTKRKRAVARARVHRYDRADGGGGGARSPLNDGSGDAKPVAHDSWAARFPQMRRMLHRWDVSPASDEVGRDGVARTDRLRHQLRETTACAARP